VNLDLGRIISRAFEISWRHKWLWLLGLFVGGGGGTLGGFRGFTVSRGRDGGSVAETVSQLQAFLAQNSWIVLVVLGALGLVVLLTFLFSCVAVPAAIWAALNLDAGREVRLGQAWSQGLRRFGPFFRLNFLRLLVALVLAAPVALSGLLLVRSLASGYGPVAGSVVLLVLSSLLFFGGSLLVSVALVWSDRLIVLSGAGALGSMRQSWWLVKRAFVDTLLFAVLMGMLAGFFGLGVALAALLVSVPGVVAAVVGFSSAGPVFIAGVAWIVVVGLGVLLIGGGFVGSLVQVAYALACRDLCRRHGIQVVESLASDTPPPVASQAVPAT
jgi:hypothetical protein